MKLQLNTHMHFITIKQNCYRWLPTKYSFESSNLLAALLLNPSTSPSRIVHFAVVFDGFNITLALFFLISHLWKYKYIVFNFLTCEESDIIKCSCIESNTRKKIVIKQTLGSALSVIFSTVTRLCFPLRRMWALLPLSFGSFDEDQPTISFEFIGTTTILSLKYVAAHLTEWGFCC